MMVNVSFLAQTGFFQWFAVKVVELSNRSIPKLFFLLTNITGLLSAFLDNVTVVMLLGPLTISLTFQLIFSPLLQFSYVRY